MFWLIFAHFLGDYPLQGDYLAVNKGKSLYAMLAHVTIWTGCICVALALTGDLQGWHAYVLFIPHFISDWAKCRYPDRYGLAQDQLVHAAQLVAVWGIR